MVNKQLITTKNPPNHQDFDKHSQFCSTACLQEIESITYCYIIQLVATKCIPQTPSIEYIN